MLDENLYDKLLSSIFSFRACCYCWWSIFQITNFHATLSYVSIYISNVGSFMLGIGYVRFTNTQL